MTRILTLISIFILCHQAVFSAYKDGQVMETVRDSVVFETGDKPVKSKRPMFIAAKFNGSMMLPTNDFIRGKDHTQYYKGAALKFAWAAKGDKWQDIAYNMPYYGIGVYGIDFNRRDSLGNPVAIYLFQGAKLARLSPKFRINYELNLGASFGWKPYDPFNNPDNVTVGTEVNVYVGAMVYLKWLASEHLDFNLGVEFTHFSNGSVRSPNKGLNSGGIFLEAVYNFNRGTREPKRNLLYLLPASNPKYVSEILVNISSRQEEVDNTDTGRPDKYIDRKFAVLGLSYSFMRAPNHCYRYGISADLIYDESSGVRAWRQEKNGQWYERVKKGKVGDRFAFGLSIKGEIKQKWHSIFANLGYDIIHGNKQDHRFYQVIGLKVYLKENFFATFGVRATHFSSSQFLYWSLGYTIDHGPSIKKRSSTKGK